MTRDQLVAELRAGRKQREQVRHVETIAGVLRPLPPEQVGRDLLRDVKRMIEILGVRDRQDDRRDPGDDEYGDGKQAGDAGAPARLAVVRAVLAHVPAGDGRPNFEERSGPDGSEPGLPQAGICAGDGVASGYLDRRRDQPESDSTGKSALWWKQRAGQSLLRATKTSAHSPKRVDAFGRTTVRSRRWKTQNRPCRSRMTRPVIIRRAQLNQSFSSRTLLLRYRVQET